MRWLLRGLMVVATGLLPGSQVRAAEPAAVGNPAGDRPQLRFETDVWPIFRAHCFDCHGATSELKGGLDLRLVRRMLAGGDSGPAVVAGRPSESLLLERIRSGEMPPGQAMVTAAEIAVIDAWIAQGAGTVRPEPESIPPGIGVTPEERQFWSFQPVVRPEIPPVNVFPPEARVRTVIDALVATSSASLTAEGSSAAGTVFEPDADRRTLIKRAWLHLTGLPPSPDDMHEWTLDSAPDWYDRLLTKLLQSPHYGELWARHWLDVAGYADSEGYTASDVERSWSWKYRDWVTEALNDDKPFDEFVIEQLAGDELAGPVTGDLSDRQIGLLTATGFLRMAADGTGSGANHAEGRNQVMTDTLKIVGTSLLGLSLHCAQCHDHRYDPIAQTDYYALRAVFEPALDWNAWKVPAARRVSLYTESDRRRAAEIEAEAQAVAQEKSARQADYLMQALEKELTKFKEPLRGQLREAYQTPDSKRTEAHKELLKKHPSVNITAGVLYQYLPEAAEELKKYDQQISEIRARKPVEEFLRALVEPPGHVPETRLFHRGNPEQPREVVAPASLTVTSPVNARREFPLNDDQVPSTGRRLAFARWLVSGEHPLVARVIVNRIWAHHFGKGLVETPSDFGRLGARPSSQSLLDLLADELVRRDWSLKQLHKLILSSTVWRQVRGGRNRLVRLEAETLRDRMLAASGQLDRTLFGRPVPIREDDTGQVVVDGTQTRRSLYVQVRRSRPVAMLQAFDAPVMQTNCEARVTSTAATQSLMLLNGEFVLTQAEKLAARAARETAELPAETRAGLPEIPPPVQSAWSYGFGAYDDAAGRTGAFQKLTHWTGDRWQHSGSLPDPEVGYCFLTASGGHPDVPQRAVIRRWTARESGTLSISGSLQHGSSNGDGVRGRVVSSRTGLAGEWSAFNGATETRVGDVAVEHGDTIDFITDCLEHQTSDSFNWPVRLQLVRDGHPVLTAVSQDDFRGPAEPRDMLPAQAVRAWELALCRAPEREELQQAVEFISRQISTFQTPDRIARLPENRTPSRQAMIDLCQILLTTNEFLYID